MHAWLERLQPSNHASKHRSAGKGVSGPAQRRMVAGTCTGTEWVWARICLFGMHGDLMGMERTTIWVISVVEFPGRWVDVYMYTCVHIRRRYT